MHASEDKKAKEAAEAKNAADNAIFQSEKTLGELGDKVTEAEKQPVRDAIEKLKKTKDGGDTEAIKADTEALQKAFYDISAKLYQQQQQSGGQSDNGGSANNGGAWVTTEFTTPNSPTRPTTAANNQSKGGERTVIPAAFPKWD